MIEKLHVLIRGRVQGVGFRYHTQAKALELCLSGWVRNLSDGAVEAEFEGSRSALEAMEAWCRIGPRLAFVESVETEWGSAEKPRYAGFSVTG